MSRLANARSALRRHPRAADAAVALLLAAFVLQEIFGSDVDGSVAITVPCALGATLPLAWRRRAPLAAVTACMGSNLLMSLLYDGTHEPQGTLVALLLAVYSVGAHAEQRAAIAGLALSLAALLVDEPGDVIVMWPVFVLAWSAGRLVRARERDARKLGELAAALERERVEEARIAVIEERARIARELHDVIAHAMSSIVLEAGAERVNLAGEQASTRATLTSIERTGRAAMVEMRRLVGVLRDDDEDPDRVPHPGLAQLGALAEHVGRSGVPVETLVVGDPVELPPGLDISAYPDRAGGAHQRDEARRAGARERRAHLRRAHARDRGERRRAWRRAERKRARAHRPARARRAVRRRAPGRRSRRRRVRRPRLPAVRVRPPVTVRVLIADDQAVVRTGLRRILEVDPEIAVAGEAVDGLAAVEAAQRLLPDVVLMDIRMPRLDGLAAAERILAAGAEPPRVLMLTTFGLDEYVFEALRAGASGFLLKDATPEEILAGRPRRGARRHPARRRRDALDRRAGVEPPGAAAGARARGWAS